MELTSSMRSRFEPSTVTALLAVGDVLMITAFVVRGEMQHGFDPVTDAGRVVGTLVPFLAGWLVVSFVGSLYTREAVSSVRRTLSWTVPAWVFAVGIALAIRASPYFHGGAALTFALVAVFAGGTLVIGWRLLATVAVASLAGNRLPE